jgi:hypothetical protein
MATMPSFTRFHDYETGFLFLSLHYLLVISQKGNIFYVYGAHIKFDSSILNLALLGRLVDRGLFIKVPSHGGERRRDISLR